MKRTCDNCGRQAPEAEQMYSMKIDMFARVEPIVIEMKDLAKDSMSKLEQLVEQMAQLDPEEATDQVYESYTFDLCFKCRSRIHRQLKHASGGEVDC